MGFTFESWPFEPLRWENDGTWWEKCHLPGGAETILDGSSNWVALIGGPASGKSTVLAYLKRKALAENAFVMDYPLEQWPRKKHQPTGQSRFMQKEEEEEKETHLERLMGLAFQSLCEKMVDHPELIDQLSDTQRIFIRWVLETFVGRFAFSDWLDSLPKSYDDQLRKIDASMLTEDPGLKTNIHRQLTQLVAICRRVGFPQVKVFMDIPPYLSADQEANLVDFFQELELKQKSGFYCISALPQEIADREDIKTKVRGRVYLRELEMSAERTTQIVNNLLTVATRGSICSIEKLATGLLHRKLYEMIEEEFGGPAPGAWVAMTRILLEYGMQHELPCPDTCFEDFRIRFYKMYMKLHILPDAARMGIWRGHKFIPMDEGPYEFVITLWKNRGKPVDFEQLEESKGNTHTLASRARSRIEPVSEQHIYIANRKNEGYWLENYI